MEKESLEGGILFFFQEMAGFYIWGAGQWRDSFPHTNREVFWRTFYIW